MWITKRTCQDKLIQKTIPCNKWLHNIKIKNCSVCEFCMNVDDLPHFFIRCLKVKEFWLHSFNWCENLSGIVIRNSEVIEECILFGFPSNSDVMQVQLLYIICKILYLSNIYLIITHLTSIPAWTNSSKPWKQENIYIKKNKKEKFLK